MFKVFTRTTTVLLFISLIGSKKILAQTQSDVCGSPIPLTVGTTCSPTLSTLFNANDEGTKTSTCATSTYDVWYSFTTPANKSAINIDVTPEGGSPNNIVATKVFVEVFRGTSCAPILLGACTPVGTTLSLTGLSTSTTYFVRVFANTDPSNNASRWDFNICITADAAPTNDDCSGAVSLASGVANTNGTLWSSTASAGVPAGCATGTPDDDVWYQVTAAGAATLNVALSAVGSDLNSSGARLQLYPGNCSATPIACGTNSISTSVTAGTYYIRVYSAGSGATYGTAAGSQFTITATLAGAPSNDECTGAITLSSGVANNAGTVWLATGSGVASPSCATGNPDDDVWYKITPSGTNLTVTLSAPGTDLNTSGTRLQLFSGACGSLSPVACGISSINSTVNSGSVYYIRVYSAGTGSLGSAASGSAFTITATAATLATVSSGRMNEVFARTVLSGSGLLNYPWEITYGPDNYLWITESKGYKVYKMDPNNGTKTTVLDISQGSTTSPDNSFNCQFNNGQGAQGGLAGLALHPNFLDGTANEKNWVYISYIRSSLGSNIFVNRVARFTYNKATNRLESPVSICDTLPGSNDHNSQRMFIAPATPGGPNYLFYASGDMGAGQGGNINRPIRSQYPYSYEGKILRFNLDVDSDNDPDAYDNWIPNDNPYNAMLGKQSAVWNIGMRNNQGFAYDTSLNILYGSSHGPYSDDEINIIEKFKNYGHPLVIGYVADGNYDGTLTQGLITSMSAGAPYNTGSGISSCSPIGSEATRKAEIDASGNGLYKDPLFSAYAETSAGPGSVRNIWQTTTGANSGWPSEGWSGLDFYSNKVIPGWKQSLIAGGLKWGRLVRLKLGANGTTVVPTGPKDTITYFQSTNRYRDLTFAPNGKDIYIVMDNNSATSGPGIGNPIVPACPGCVIKYTFLGYADNGGKSTIPTSIDVTSGTNNSCNTGTPVTIDASNNTLWVPITGPDGNIMAEINAMGQNLGLVTSSFYQNTGAIRVRKGFRYLDRNITITPAVTSFATPVKIRLYITKAEFDALDADPGSGITSGIGQLKILKNNDPCSASLNASTIEVPITISNAERVHGANGYVLQGEVTGFSTFYFSATNITLPVGLLTFKGSLQNNATLLRWETEHESNTSHFVIERSIDGRSFDAIGTMTANGTGNNKYMFNDDDVMTLSSNLIYYRLKMMDKDGQFTYSSIVTIQIADITSTIVLSPNPASEETKALITSNASGKAHWKLTDNNGRVVMQGTVQLRKGNNNLSINVSRLAGGVYYLSVNGAGLDKKIKLQKL